MSNYIGITPDQVLGAVQNRFFYGLRKTDQGEIFVAKVDQIQKDASIQINNPGEAEDNFTGFTEGQDFYEGFNVKHKEIYKNLRYQQYRWDDRNIFYYVDEEGNLVARINQTYTYDDTVSSSGE